MNLSAIVKRSFDDMFAWQIIFDELDVRSRIRCEMTSKRLQSLMLYCWSHQASFGWPDVAEMSSTPQNRAAALLSICRTRIGEALRLLKLSSELPMSWITDLPEIAAACSALVEIEFFHITSTYAECALQSTIRFDSFARLRNLRFLTASASCDYPRKCHEQLREIVTPDQFLTLPRSLEVITGVSGSIIEPLSRNLPDYYHEYACEQLCGFFRDRQSLVEVALTCINVDKASYDEIGSVFGTIAESCQKLKRLSFEDSCLPLKGIELLSNMLELRLDISGFLYGLGDLEMEKICTRNPELQALTIRAAVALGLSRRSFGAIATLKCLRRIDLFVDVLQNEGETDDFVIELVKNSGGSLCALILEEGAPLSHRSITAMASSCLNLRLLCVSVVASESLILGLRNLMDVVVQSNGFSGSVEQLEVEIDLVGALMTGNDDIEAEQKTYVSVVETFRKLAENAPEGVSLKKRYGYQSEYVM